MPHTLSTELNPSLLGTLRFKSMTQYERNHQLFQGLLAGEIYSKFMSYMKRM